MSGANPDRLDSWKEIASYLGRDLRTVRRWERERFLPVHRVPGRGRAAVYAFRSEIDEWLRNGSNGETREADGVLDAELAAGSSGSQPIGSASTKRRWALLLGSGAVVLVVAAVLIALHLRGHGEAEIGQITFSGQQMLAWSNGKVAWSYDFGQPLADLSPKEVEGRYAIVDLNGDGRREVLVGPPLILPSESDLSTDALFCFSERGQVLWKHVFAERLRFASTQYGPRWLLGGPLLVTSEGSRRSIWCAIDNHPWWPSILFQFDAKGREASRFVNSGHIVCLGDVRTPTGRYILAGGINNEYQCAMLAILRADNPSGHSPETDPLFECDDCPQGEPYRYFLFPRSELNLIMGQAYNVAFALEVADGLVRVRISEAPNPPGSPSGPTAPADWAQYTLSQKFDPVGVAFSDHYWEDHRQLSARGKISHTVEECPERLKPITVREWSPEGGWRDIALPPIAGRHK
jgi:hypothetical protein